MLGVVLIGDSQVQSQKKTVYLEGIGRGQFGESWGGGVEAEGDRGLRVRQRCGVLEVTEMSLDLLCREK